MNFLSNLSTKKNSVNSSIATIKPPKDMNETINKYRQKCKIRFSHQEEVELPKKLQRNSSYKQNVKFEQCIDEPIPTCLNHETKKASHVVFSGSQSPMFYCERCAILIASKGFNVDPIDTDKENKNKLNSKRGSFSQYDRKQHANTQTNKTLEPCLSTVKSQQPIKVHLSNEIISSLQHCWKNLKSSRESNLNQIDMYINTLNENVDFLEDYYYVLHEYVQKQKNLELKDIMGKKQLLEQLRAEVSGFFVNSFATLKELKDKLVQAGECSLQMYQQAVQQASFNKFTLNFQAAIEEFTALNSKKELAVHKIGGEIAQIIKNFNFLPLNNESQPQKKRHSVHRQELNPVNSEKQHQMFSKLQDHYLKTQERPENHHASRNLYDNLDAPHIPRINNAQSSVRSLQLSFDNSENGSDSSGRKGIVRQETNNFTLNQYINQRGQESYTNLLMTSTDIN